MKKYLVTLFFVFLSGCPASTSNLEQRLDRAVGLLETGKPDSSAVILYELLDSIQNRNQRVSALYYLAIAMEQLGRLGEEIKYLIMAREVGTDAEFADKVRFAYAHILLDTGNLDECIGIAEEFKQYYEDSPLMPDMLYMTGNAHLLKGEYQRAYNLFNDITKQYMDSEAAQKSIMKEGICLFHLDLITGAIERLERYLSEVSEGKNTDEALYFLGLSYERREQPELAIEVLKKLVLEYPSYPEVIDVYYKLGTHYFVINRFSESENMFENYIYNTDEAHVHYDEALFYLERIKFKTGRYRSEADIAENFIVKYPQSPRAPKLLFDLAQYYKSMRKTDDAIEKYRILMNNPLYADYADSAALLKADTYTELGERGKAREFLIKTAHEARDSLRTQKMFLKLGTLSEKWGLYDEAIAWYDSSLALNCSPDFSFKALWGIARVFKTLNRWYEAAKTFERITGEYPDHPDVIEMYLSLSDIYFLQGRLKDSIRIAEKAIKLAEETRKTDILIFVAELYEEIDEDHALHLYSLIYNNDRNSSHQRTQALMQIGDLSLRKGDHKAALNAYAKIINGDADSVSVSKARRKISSINETINGTSREIPRD